MTNWIESFTEDEPVRWQPFYALIAHWFGPLSPYDGIAFERLTLAESRLGLKLPEALQEFYLLAGSRADLFCEQNKMCSPEELFIDDGHLIVWTENQSVVSWGIPLEPVDHDDPRIEMNDVRDVDAAAVHAHRWVPCNDRFSQFATQMLLMDMFALSDHGVLAFLPPAADESLSLLYERLPLPEWPWPQHPARFLADPDTVVIVDGSGSLYGSSHTAAAHDRLVAYLEGHGIDPDVEWTE